MKKLFLLLIILTAAFFMSGCYSVFNGGTGGVIVDAESTSNPKAGIAYVNIYAYTDWATRDSDFNAWKETFFSYGLMTFSNQISETSTAILVLNVCWTRKILADVLVQAYLSEKGYHTSSVFDFVKELFSRMIENEGFPHEVGVILGYPVEDVIEFENHQGHDCKYCGCWKSYSDVDKARDCHCRFTECSRLCKKWYDEGYSINQIITKYQTLKTVA